MRFYTHFERVITTYFNLVCPFKSTTQNPLVATPCGFKSHHRHHVGMDYTPFKKPSRLAGLFSYRSVIPPFPQKVPFAPAARLQAPSRRLCGTTNLLRVIRYTLSDPNCPPFFIWQRQFPSLQILCDLRSRTGLR